MMFGVVLVGTYTSVFIASPILIYLGVGTGTEHEITVEPVAEPKAKPVAASKPEPKGKPGTKAKAKS